MYCFVHTNACVVYRCFTITHWTSPPQTDFHRIYMFIFIFAVFIYTLYIRIIQFLKMLIKLAGGAAHIIISSLFSCLFFLILYKQQDALLSIFYGAMYSRYLVAIVCLWICKCRWRAGACALTFYIHIILYMHIAVANEYIIMQLLLYDCY